MNTLNPNLHSITAFAPATCANVAVGFDILGFAFENIGDTVTLTKRADQKIVIEAIHAAETLPSDTHKNTASLVIQKLCQDLHLETGFSISIQKGIPLSSGMGGSAASAVAALVACNAFLDTPLTPHELVSYALVGEALASGQPHADNVVPCIFGGFTLIQSSQPLEVIQLPIPEIFCALVHPHLQVATQEARKILKDSVSLKDHIKQSANLAAFIAALYRNDFGLIQKSLCDIIIEPQRAQFVPRFHHIKKAALDAGALGVSFSGSGPSMFAFAEQKETAERICQAMREPLKNEKIAADSWVSAISKTGAYVTARQ